MTEQPKKTDRYRDTVFLPKTDFPMKAGLPQLEPKLLERWGCRYEDIARRNPRAIVLSLSAFGEEGPYAGRTGNGTLCEAYAGVSNMIGEADGPPMRCPLEPPRHLEQADHPGSVVVDHA